MVDDKEKGHSFGGCSIRVLQQLLAEKAFEGHDDTSADWCLSLTAVNAPLNGTALVYALGEEVEKAPKVRRPSLGFFLGLAVSAQEYFDVPFLRKYVFDFRMEHFRLSWWRGQSQEQQEQQQQQEQQGGCGAVARRGLLGAVSGAVTGAVSGAGRLCKAALTSSDVFEENGDNAAYDMTVQSAAQWNRRIKTNPRTFYFSLVGSGGAKKKGAAAAAAAASSCDMAPPTEICMTCQGLAGCKRGARRRQGWLGQLSSGRSRSMSSTSPSGSVDLLVEEGLAGLLLRPRCASRSSSGDSCCSRGSMSSASSLSSSICSSASSSSSSSSSGPSWQIAVQAGAWSVALWALWLVVLGFKWVFLTVVGHMRVHWTPSLAGRLRYRNEHSPPNHTAAADGGGADGDSGLVDGLVEDTESYTSGAHDGVVSEFSQSFPRVPASHRAPVSRAPVDFLQVAGRCSGSGDGNIDGGDEELRPGLWHVAKLRMDHLSLVPFPSCDGCQRKVFSRLFRTLRRAEQLHHVEFRAAAAVLKAAPPQVTLPGGDAGPDAAPPPVQATSGHIAMAG
eukprot:g460.t1